MEHMRTIETAANLSVLTDRELIRIILYPGKKNGTTASEGSLFMFVFVLRVCFVG